MFEKHSYKIIDVIGTSEKSWEDAAANVIETVAKHVNDLRIAEVVSQDVKIEGKKIVLYRVKLKLSFKYHEGQAA